MTGTGWTSYHVHSTWSDGCESIEALVTAAREVGLAELGVSDHFVLYPGRAMDWSMPTDRVEEYAHKVLEVAARTDGVAVRLGIEVDYLPETLGETIRRIEGLPLDYRIGSVHFIDGFPVDGDATLWQPLTQDQVNGLWQEYYRRVRDMALSRQFDIVAHFDLPKKFGARPTVDLTTEIREALDAVKEADMALELNTSGLYKPAREMYPAFEILLEARSREIPLLITADAHTTEHLTRGFEEAASMAREAGYTHLARFRRRARTLLPLA